jgi:hypothetical protein
MGSASVAGADQTASEDAEHQSDGAVHFSCLRRVEASCQFAQSACVDGAHLIDEHASAHSFISISGRKIAGCALVEVGATISVESRIPSL